MAYPQAKLSLVRDNVVRILHPELLEPSTYLTAAVAAAGTTLTVKSNLGFSNTDPQDLLLFEGFGNENAEIKRVNGAITAGTSLTSQTVTFAHPISTLVYKVLFDQFEILGSSTLTGTKTSIATTNINVSGMFTDYIVTSTTYSFYFVRFYNSLATTPYYGAYSDGIASTDLATNTVGFIRRNALSNVGEELSERFNANWFYDQIYLGELDVAKELKRWSWLTSLETDIGNVSTGMRLIALPSDIEDTKTNKSILGLRIGTGQNLEYIDKTEYELLMEDVPFTTLASEASIGATTMTLTDSRDFDDSESVNIAGTSYSYTANTRTTNVLSGFSALTATISSGTNVWQNVTFGEPIRFTVYDGNIYFNIPPSSDYNGRNIWLDYYKLVSRLDSDTDTPLVPDTRLLILWCEIQIKRTKAGGEISQTDASMVEYTKLKERLIKNEYTGQKIRLVPNIPLTTSRPFSWWNR